MRTSGIVTWISGRRPSGRRILAVAALLALVLLPLAGCDDNKAVPDNFVFATDPPSAYGRVDRMGMPAIATAVITSKDAYNDADPVDDAAGDFVPEIVANVDHIHDLLDDDLTGAGLTPCTGGGGGSCVAQAGPLVVPDVIRIDTASISGFPNGRRLTDPVIDVTLAVVLLDLGVHSVTTLADIPLNPPANDVAFLAGFPYLAAPHTP